MSYSWERECRNTRIGGSFEKTTEEKQDEINRKLCKTCKHYDFYKCVKNQCRTGPDADNTNGQHDECYEQK